MHKSFFYLAIRYLRLRVVQRTSIEETSCYDFCKQCLPHCSRSVMIVLILINLYRQCHGPLVLLVFHLYLEGTNQRTLDLFLCLMHCYNRTRMRDIRRFALILRNQNKNKNDLRSLLFEVFRHLY